MKLVLFNKKILTMLLLSGVLLQLCSCGVGTGQSLARGENMFPHVGGQDLQGAKQTFPHCLSAEQTIVIVAFERWQQSWVDEWYAKIKLQRQGNEQLEYYEVPTIAKLTGPVRWWIYRGMRSGITEEYMRRRVITLHIDKEPFKKQLAITDEKIVYVYLLDRQGRIKARQQGRFSKQKWQAFQRSLQE